MDLHPSTPVGIIFAWKVWEKLLGYRKGGRKYEYPASSSVAFSVLSQYLYNEVCLIVTIPV